MSASYMGTKRTAEVTAAYDGAATGVMTGLLAGTCVATAMGWRRVDAMAEGDQVLTFDNGLQEVTKVTRIRLWDGEGQCPRRFWPLEVQAGALGNRSTLKILPSQPVMLESDAAETLYDDPFALVRARVLEGIRGIDRTPPANDAEVILLYFADEQVVFGKDGALIFCPSSRDLIERSLDGDDSQYSILPMHEAIRLVDKIEGDSWCRGPAAPYQTNDATAA
ncbi:Hint domain-containing protein [Roseovarius bejariae]|nr:Hint domain-containing protein [Roseovarius bejariae]